MGRLPSESLTGALAGRGLIGRKDRSGRSECVGGVAASTELQERDALKNVSLAAAMTTTLLGRGIPEPTAHLAGEMGVLAFKRGYAKWTEAGDDELAPHTLAALRELRAASASLNDG